MEVEIYVMAYTMQKFYDDSTPLHTHVCERFKNDVVRFLPDDIDIKSISYREDPYVTKFLNYTFSSSQSNTIQSLMRGGLNFYIGYYTIRVNSEDSSSDDLEWIEETFVYMQQQHELIASYFLILNGNDFYSFKHIKSSQTNESDDLFEDAQHNFNEYAKFFASYLRDRVIREEYYHYAAKLLLSYDDE